MISVILAAVLYPVVFAIAANRKGRIPFHAFTRGWRFVVVLVLAAMGALVAICGAPIVAAMTPGAQPFLTPAIDPSLANVCRGAFGLFVIFTAGVEFVRLCERKSTTTAVCSAIAATNRQERVP
jgi:hypothetical protein